MPENAASAQPVMESQLAEHRHLFPLRWADMDALRHVNNTVYFRAIEEARMQIFGPLRQLFEPGTGVVLARAECDFIKPISWPGNIEIVHRPQRIGRSSLDCAITVCRENDPDTVYARSRAVVVLSHLESGTSRPWPAPLLAALKKQFAPAADPVGQPSTAHQE